MVWQWYFLSRFSSSWFLLQRHPGGNAKASHGEATYSQVPRDGRRPSVHDLPCEASRSAKMGEGRSDRNLYAHGGAARRRNQGGDRGSAPTLGSKCRDLPGRPGEARGEPQWWAVGEGRWGDRTTKIGEWGKRGLGHDLPGREARGEGGPRRWTSGAGQRGLGEADRQGRQTKKQKRRGVRARNWTEGRVRGKGEGAGP